MKFILHPIIIGLLLGGTGCATLSPPPHDPNKARIDLTSGIDLLKLDGKNMLHLTGGFSKNPYALLPPGPHTLVLRFSSIEDIDDDNYVKFTSNPVTVELTVKGGDIYTTEHQGPEEITHPDKMNKDVPIKVVQVHAGDGPTATETPKPAEPAEPQALNLLKHWWEQASGEERESFRKWIKPQ